MMNKITKYNCYHKKNNKIILKILLHKKKNVSKK